MIAMVGVAFVVWVGCVVVYAVMEHARRERTKVTMQRIRAIAIAFEQFADETYPCVERGIALPPELVSRLDRATLRDGWGRPMIIFSDPDRFIVMSLGSDGRADDGYETGTFEDDRGDLVYSNEGFLHFPVGVSGAAESPPKVEHALAEIGPCDHDHAYFATRISTYAPFEKL